MSSKRKEKKRKKKHEREEPEMWAVEAKSTLTEELVAGPPMSQAMVDALEWLDSTPHREGCQCHRCLWACGVRAGRIAQPFDTWRVS